MNKEKSILCIVPLSPPVTGASFASETIVNFLKQRHNVDVIPFQRGNLISGNFSLSQLVKISAIGMTLLFKRKRYDSVYLVNSSSLWGNKRDLFFLFMMGKRLRKKTVLHRHGANFVKYINRASFLARFLNKKFFGDVRYAIVLGGSLKDIFDGYIQKERIGIVNNFFTPSLLIPEERLSAKFNSDKINILFLSNLINKKGYTLLLDAFQALPEDSSRNAELHFAGELHSSENKELFENKIKANKNIFYHGPVAGMEKQELLWNAHIFCLPTIYKFEGQPISILEAYAAGCIVIATLNGGIKDIFIDQVNGHALDVNWDIDVDRLREKMTNDLKEKLETIIKGAVNYKNIACFNRKEAMNKYTEESFCRNVEKILIEDEVNEIRK